MTELAPEMTRLASDLGQVLSRRSPLYAAGFELNHWARTSPRKFFVRRLDL